MENLFGFEESKKNGRPPTKNKDYKSFIEKFETKLTTDDCYTPDYVYNTILDFVSKNSNIEGLDIIRPFYPGGDYVNYDYPENCIVIDNPPFSIVTPIVRFYNERGIKYFLFAPHLILFHIPAKNYIITSSSLVYENKAKINTSFVANIFATKIWGCSELYRDLKEVMKINSDTLLLPNYSYPDEVLTVSRIAKITNKGVSIKIDSNMKFVKELDSQQPHKKNIFGGAFLLSRKAIDQLKKAEKKAETAVKTKIIWTLSEREVHIVDNL